MRGCEKRIYHVKDAGSPLFEEAYFILRRPLKAKGGVPVRGGSLAEEAERIIRESGTRLCAMAGQVMPRPAATRPALTRRAATRHAVTRPAMSRSENPRPAPIHRLSPPAAFLLGAGTTSLFIGLTALLWILL